LIVVVVVVDVVIELQQECDYLREAENQKKMRKLLESHERFYVPKVIDEFTTKHVMTTGWLMCLMFMLLIM